MVWVQNLGGQIWTRTELGKCIDLFAWTNFIPMYPDLLFALFVYVSLKIQFYNEFINNDSNGYS